MLSRKLKSASGKATSHKDFVTSNTSEGLRRSNPIDLSGLSPRQTPPHAKPTKPRFNFRGSMLAQPPEKLPFYKFDFLLRNRFKYLRLGSDQLSEIVEELDLAARKRTLYNDFEAKLLGQPPSTYEGLPKSGREALSWSASPGIPPLNELKSAYEAGDHHGLDRAIVQGFGIYASMQMLSPEEIELQKKLADCSRPADWYPLARSMTRKLHLHVGPTNSGKTYHALQRLKHARSGNFAGPLRLLAFEVYERFNKEGTLCNLSTGEEKRMTDGVTLCSSTIEMLNLSQEIDVLVIDEIQMIADPGRGSAWTHALLGAPAKEIHMCGEASVVDLVKSIASSLGETVEVHNYSRLGGLQPLNESLGGTFQSIEAGDAVVTFSRQNIFAVKKSIEATSAHKCAVVYGGLPPETRAAQARLFNEDENNFQIIVASDAIGMGLNLSIKRVIFETLEKWNGKEMVKLPIPQIKQIAGRAGRFKPKAKVENELDPPKDIPGYVTTLQESDIPFLHAALATPTVQLTKAILRPSSEIVERFIRPYPIRMRLSMAMQQFQAFAQTSDLYGLVDLTSGNEVLDLLQTITGLSFRDKWTLLEAPLKKRDPQCVKAYLQMARAIGEGTTGDILSLSEVTIDLLDEGVPKAQEQLAKLESLHAQLTLYLWLALRFPGIFPSLIETYQLKEYTEETIQEGLDSLKVKAVRGRQPEQFISSAMKFQMNKPRGKRVFQEREERRPSAFARL